MPLLSRRGAPPLLRTVLNQAHATDNHHVEQRREPIVESGDSALDFGPAMSYNELTEDPISSGREGSDVEVVEERAKTSRATKPGIHRGPSKRAPVRVYLTSRNTNEKNIRKRKSQEEHDGSSSQKSRLSPEVDTKEEEVEPAWAMKNPRERPSRPKPIQNKYGKREKSPDRRGVTRSLFTVGGQIPQKKRSSNTSASKTNSDTLDVPPNPYRKNGQKEASESKENLKVMHRSFDVKTEKKDRDVLKSMNRLGGDIQEAPRDVLKTLVKSERPDHVNFKRMDPIDDQTLRLTAGQLDPAAPDVSSPLSEPDELSVYDLTKYTEIGDEGPGVPLAVCPYCQTEVDPDFLLEYSKGQSRMRIRDQMAFCAAHKQRSAKLDYDNKGYPSIEWETLEQRFKQFDLHLAAVMENDTDSHFRQKLAETADSGKDRNLLQAAGSGSLQGLTPGYYGTKGARLMDNYIIRKHGPKLRRLATRDKVIASRDTSGFVQAVLVPELAMKLIMDDMHVNDVKARQIMKDSIGLGDVVNEDEDDVLKATQAATQMIPGDSSDEDHDME